MSAPQFLVDVAGSCMANKSCGGMRQSPRRPSRYAWGKRPSRSHTRIVSGWIRNSPAASRTLKSFVAIPHLPHRFFKTTLHCRELSRAVLNGSGFDSEPSQRLPGHGPGVPLLFSPDAVAEWIQTSQIHRQPAACLCLAEDHGERCVELVSCISVGRQIARSFRKREQIKGIAEGEN